MSAASLAGIGNGANPAHSGATLKAPSPATRPHARNGETVPSASIAYAQGPVDAPEFGAHVSKRRRPRAAVLRQHGHTAVLPGASGYAPPELCLDDGTFEDVESPRAAGRVADRERVTDPQKEDGELVQLPERVSVPLHGWLFGPSSSSLHGASAPTR